MSATAKRPVGINEAATGIAFEHRADAVIFFREIPPAGGAVCLGCEQSFTLGQMWRQAGELKLAAFCPRDTVTLYGPFSKVLINGADFRKNF